MSDGRVSITAAAKRAYEAYGAHVGWLAVSGQPMPTWEALQPRIRNAWEEATRGAFGLEPLRAPGSGAPPPPPPAPDVLERVARLEREAQELCQRFLGDPPVVGEELRHDPTAG